MTLRSRDFKSLASTDFAIRAVGIEKGYFSTAGRCASTVDEGDAFAALGADQAMLEARVGIEPAYTALQAAA